MGIAALTCFYSFIVAASMAVSASATPESLTRCGVDGTHCAAASDLARPETATSLLQSGMARSPLPTSVLEEKPYARLDDEFDENDKEPTRRSILASDDPSFYLGICLDVLVVLIVADGIKRFRAGREPANLPASGHARRGGAMQSVMSAEQKAAKVASLHTHIRDGDVVQCEKILNEAGPLAARLLNEPDSWGCSALHLAASSPSEPLVELFLERGAKVGSPDAWEQTPLHFAARAGNVGICRMLLDRGAHVDAVDAQDQTPLHAAAMLGLEAVCELLLDRGGGLSSATDADVPPILSSLLVQRMFRHG